MFFLVTTSLYLFTLFDLYEFFINLAIYNFIILANWNFPVSILKKYFTNSDLKYKHTVVYNNVYVSNYPTS